MHVTAVWMHFPTRDYEDVFTTSEVMPPHVSRMDLPLPSDQTIRLSVCQRETPHDDGLAQVSSLIGLLPFT